MTFLHRHFKGIVALAALVLSSLAVPASASTSGPKEIVFIDSAVQDAQVLMDGIRPGVEVIRLGAGRDGVGQIAETLTGRSGIDAIHIISHGGAGELHLGALSLSSQNLQEHAVDLAAIRTALNQNADILLYGCNVANGADGAAFVDRLARATDAHVAASTNVTGSARLGGDWVLEYKTGRVSTPVVTNGAGYEAVLGVPLVLNPGSAPGIYTRPGTTGITWSYGTSTVGAQSGLTTANIEYHDVPAFSWILTRGSFEYSTNGGSSWTPYTLGTFTPVAGTIWHFVDTGNTTTMDNVGFAWQTTPDTGTTSTGTSVGPDNAPTDIVSTRNYMLSDSTLGSAIATLTPTDTGYTTGGYWAIDSQSIPNLFTIGFNAAAGNTATLSLGSGVMPAIGQTATVTARYYDIYQTDGSGNPIGGQGFAKTLTFTVVSATSQDLSFGNDLKISTFAANDQINPSVTTLSNGNFVSVWQSSGQGGESVGVHGIYGQIYTASGAAVGSEFAITATNNGINEIVPVVSALNAGRFVVAYTSTPGANGLDVAYRIVEANGVVGSELIANTVVAGDQTAPAVATLTDGSFMITWATASGDIHAQKFNAADGSKNGGELTINKTAGNTTNGPVFVNPGIAALSNGGYAVAWGDAFLGNVFAITDAGAADIAVDSSGASWGYNTPRVRIAGLSGGGFVVTFDAYINNAGSTSDIFARRYDNTGTAQAVRFQVNTNAAGDKFSPVIAGLSGGGFVVAWQSSDGDYDLNGIFGRRYTSAGVAVDANEFEINQYRRGDQNSPAISALASNAFATVWTDNTSDTSSPGIEGRVLVINTGPVFIGATTTLTVNANSGATDIKSLLHVSDADSAQTETWTQSVAPNHGGTLTMTGTTASSGSVDITPGGTLTYAPAANYAGTETFTIQVSDGSATDTRTITVTVDAVAPGAPVIGTATAGDTQATVTFTAPVNNGGSAITGYTVISSPAGGTDSNAGSTGLSHVVTGLTNGVAYTFTVTATNVAGTGSASAASNSVTPKAGQIITFNNPGAQNFGTTPTLTATATSGLTPTFTSSTTGVCTVTSGGVLTFVTAGSCTINADQSGNGSFSAASQVTQTFTVNAVAPGAPVIGSATGGNTQATVTFSAPASNGGSAITGYTVVSSPAGGIDSNAGTTGLSHVVTGLTNGVSYTFTVTATSSAGTGAASAASNSVTPATVPGAPTIGTATGGNGQATVTFSAPASNGGAAITGYTVVSSPAGGTDSNAGTTGLSHVVTGLTNGVSYTFTVTATNSAGTGAASAASNSVIPATVPGAPTIGTATAGDTQATVTFTAPGSNGGAAITGYTVVSSPAGGTDSNAGTTGLSHVVTGLTNGVAYTFAVTATNTVGTGSPSAASNSVIPKANQTIVFANPSAQNFGTTPTLTATATSGLTPTFTSSSAGVCTITSGGALTFVSAGNCIINADQSGSATFNAAPQVTRSFAVNAIVPGAPVIGTATAGDTQATVTFTAPASNGGSAITGYTVISNPAGGADSNAGTTGLSHVVTGLTNGVAYTFTVTATNSAGAGSASAASNSVTPKSSQTITFANPGARNFGTSPTLTASATSGLIPTFTSSTTGVCTITSGGTLTFLTAGTCTINADQAGNASFNAAPQVIQSFTVNAVVPTAPVIGTATAGDTQATVTFTAPASNGGAAITGYTVISNPAGGTDSNAGTTGLSHIVTGLTNGVAYTFTVTASNSAGTGAASAASNSITPKAGQTITFANPGPKNFGTTPTLTATATSSLVPTFTSSSPAVCTITSGGALTFLTAGTCVINADQAGNGSFIAAPQVVQSFAVVAVVPGAPVIGIATAGNAQATVTFTAPSSNGGVAITGYTVVSSPAGGIDSNAGTAGLSHVVTGLTNGVAYTFTVTATNSVGAGAASAASNSVMPAATAYTGPSATGSGTITANLSAGPGCGFTKSVFIPISGGVGSPPAGSTPLGSVFPHGLFDFTVGSCAPGSSITLTLTYPQALPAGTVYWKYGPTAANVTPHWYLLPATISGTTATFSITDGGLGDDDLSANGTIVDQGGPGVPSGEAVAAIPTLSDWARLLLAVMMAAMGVVVIRRRRL